MTSSTGSKSPLRSCVEAKYWLRLLAEAGKLPKPCLEPLLDESNQLVAMLSKAVAKVKGKAKPVAP